MLCPSVNGTWAVLKFRCFLAVEMASLAAGVSAPSGPAASRKSDADKLAMHLKSFWKPGRRMAADTLWLVLMRWTMSAKSAMNSGSSNLLRSGAR